MGARHPVYYDALLPRHQELLWEWVIHLVYGWPPANFDLGEIMTMVHRLALLLLSLLTSPAHAHPGAHHGGLWDGIVHLLSEPDHLAGLVLAVLVGGILGYRRLRQGRARK